MNSSTRNSAQAQETPKKVMILGATGQVGSAVAQQIVTKNTETTAIVRSPGKLSDDIKTSPNFRLIEGSFLEMSSEELIPHFEGVDVVICCLGKGGKKAFSGTPDLLQRSLKRIHEIISVLNSNDKVKLTFLSSAGIDNPSGTDQNRGLREKATQWFSGLISSHIRDYNHAMDYLCNTIGEDSPDIEWIVIRPTFFKDGPISEYTLHESGVGYLSEQTTVDNMADFHCQLALHDEEWAKWAYKMPVIFDT